MRASDKQMTAGELLSLMKRKDQSLDVVFDFVFFRPKGIHSYRGYYEDLAIGYQNCAETTVGDMVAMLDGVIGQTLYGYKGGEYYMDTDTVLWVANHNESGGTAIVDVVDDEYRIILKTEMVD